MDLAAASKEFATFMWAEVSDGDKYLAVSTSNLYPRLKDVVLYTPLVAVGMWVIKMVLEMVVFQPISVWLLGLKKSALPFKDEKLEALYQKHRPGVPDINAIKSMSKDLDKSVEDLNKWFRSRQVMDRDVVKMKRCSEIFWRLGMYSCCLFVNLSILRNKTWWKDVKQTWEGIPFQPQEEEVKLFFVALEIPLYLVLLFSQLTDQRRAKDMWEMTTHHTLVVVMLSLIYLGNFCRIGMVGLALHDVTDLFLESSKLANLLRYRGVADVLFTIFSFSWIYARLYKFSSTVHLSFFRDGSKVAGAAAVNVFGGLLLVLFLLNVFWAFKILSLMYRLLWAGSDKNQQQRDFTDLSTDDDVDSDSSYLSDAEPLRRHEHED